MIDVDKILIAVKKEFDEAYIRYYVNNNMYDYFDEEDVEDFEKSQWGDFYDYYANEGVEGNGFEGDIINDIGRWVSEEFKISEEDLWNNEDFRYNIDYYIQEFFPFYYFVDYRKKTDLDNLIDSLD